MRLERIVVKGYKHLKDICIDFDNRNRGWRFPVRFFAGLNGSGKSAFLEACALIFSRAEQNETPGFYYEMKYRIRVGKKEHQVSFRPASRHEQGRLYVEIDGKRYPSFENRREYLPHKLIAYISGANSQMEDLMVKMAKEAVISEIYDLREDEAEIEREQLLESLENMENNPGTLFLNEEALPLILFSLCAWKPSQKNPGYAGLREKILKRIGGNAAPVFLSLKFDRENISSALFEAFIEKRAAGADSVILSGEGSEETVVFPVSAGGNAYGAERAGEIFDDPLMLLAVLLREKQERSLTEAHVFFRMDADGRELINEKALSDGELMWAARTGIVLLARQKETDNCLFLFDEPDVHLNEKWNVEFVSFLQELSSLEDGEVPAGRLEHEFLVATHSSLLLTDALPEQICLFEKRGGRTVLADAVISPFGADRDEICRYFFDGETEVGSYSEGLIRRVLEGRADQEQMIGILNSMGPGIRRFRMLDRFYNGENEDRRR